MAVLYDLVPSLLRATQRDLAGRDGDVPSEDVAGIAVLLGVAAEIMPAHPGGGAADVPVLREQAQDCLDAAMRAVRRKRDLS